ncbi:MAG: hypothetical protein HYV38_03685 [Candidatus Levybacteria bacterium]|nr:hypothetical protein [Candidatus Levybacteria bacterium]
MALGPDVAPARSPTQDSEFIKAILERNDPGLIEAKMEGEKGGSEDFSDQSVYGVSYTLVDFSQKIRIQPSETPDA